MLAAQRLKVKPCQTGQPTTGALLIGQHCKGWAMTIADRIQATDSFAATGRRPPCLYLHRGSVAPQHSLQSSTSERGPPDHLPAHMFAVTMMEDQDCLDCLCLIWLTCKSAELLVPAHKQSSSRAMHDSHGRNGLIAQTCCSHGGPPLLSLPLPQRHSAVCL